MGIFGAGIFADDDARDIRADYKYFLADAQSNEGATDDAAREYGAAFDHPEQNTSFWLALAWTQWTVGRLDPRVKDTALRVIDDRLDLKRWENSPLRAKREKALAAARVKLLSPQPAAKALPRPLPVQLPGWQFGEVIGVRLAQGRLALLHMIAYRKSSRYGVKAPVFLFSIGCARSSRRYPTKARLHTSTGGRISSASSTTLHRHVGTQFPRDDLSGSGLPSR